MLHIERLSKAIDSMGKSMLELRTNRKSDLTVTLRWLKQNPLTTDLKQRLKPIIESEERWEGAIPCTHHPLDATFSVPSRVPVTT